MSSPESVSSRIARRGSSIAIWKISARFFSPPEKPSFTERVMSFGSRLTKAAFSRIRARKSVTESGSSPRCSRTELSAVRRNWCVETPGSSIGYWNARKSPSRARSSGASSRRSAPSNVTEPSVIS